MKDGGEVVAKRENHEIEEPTQEPCFQVQSWFTSRLKVKGKLCIGALQDVKDTI